MLTIHVAREPEGDVASKHRQKLEHSTHLGGLLATLDLNDEARADARKAREVFLAQALGLPSLTNLFSDFD